MWYGVCNTNAFQHSQNCPYNGTAIEMPQAGLDLLKERCGFLLQNNENKYCCDTEQVMQPTFLINNILNFYISYLQVKILNKNVKLAGNFLDRCPSCMENLVRHICEFTCSPKQSEFMHVAATEKNNTGDYYKYLFFVYLNCVSRNKTIGLVFNIFYI